jgi:peptidoglycan hydrolase-like protein with peptidoglycan-binding domain
VGTPDGAFGPKTRSGIRQLQEARGLEPTGIVDAAVLASLGSRIHSSDDDEFVSNPFAVRQDTAELEMLGEAEEIVSVLKCLGLRKSIYGKFEDSFYIAILYSGAVQGARLEAEKCGVDLAALTSREENAFVGRMTSSDPAFFNVGYDSKTNTSYKSGPYFGFRKDPEEDNAVVGWRWYTGEPVDYTNWLPSKPNRTHGAGKKAFAQFQYEARGRKDLSAVVPSQWFDGSGGHAGSVLLEGRLP